MVLRVKIEGARISPGTPSSEFRILFLFFVSFLNKTGRLNLRMNSLVVHYWAQKCARVAKKRPILWRIIRRSNNSCVKNNDDFGKNYKLKNTSGSLSTFHITHERNVWEEMILDLDHVLAWIQ